MEKRYTNSENIAAMMTGPINHADDLDARRSILRQGAHGPRLPELRKALFRPTAQWARLALLFCLIPLGATSPAPAQEEAQVVEEEVVVVDQGFEIAESNFDQWIFGGQHADHGRKKIESALSLKIAAIDQACRLSEAQTAKLHLAGQGDIKRFYDDVAVARAKFMRVRRNRNGINNIWQHVQPLQARVNAGLFGRESFFQKVLNRTLDDEQSARFAESEGQRWRFRHGARLGLVVAMLERTVPLRDRQREQFVAVLKAETEPVHVNSQYDYYLALYQIARVPAEKLEPIFDEAQWKIIQKFRAQGLQMHQVLKQQKVLP